jgi:peptidoglycan/xylan/chitin deacetylase (PgdA/CDA1 family)
MTALLSILLHDVYVQDPDESGFPGVSANRYKLSLKQFEAQLAGLWAVRKDAPILVGSPMTDRRFAITVDDGGMSYFTCVAGELEALGWRGHCFVTTGAIGSRGFLGKREIRELHERGHAIGSHSVTHPLRFSALSRVSMLREWRDSHDTLSDILGKDVTVASIPGGAFSPLVATTAREAGFHSLFTSEPQTRVSVLDGCTVFGRYTVRASSRPDFARRIGQLDASARIREWVVWNAKQRVKSLLAFAAPQHSLASSNQ